MAIHNKVSLVYVVVGHAFHPWVVVVWRVSSRSRFALKAAAWLLR